MTLAPPAQTPTDPATGHAATVPPHPPQPLPAPQGADLTPAGADVVQRSWVERYALLVLLAITLLGGALRFYHLGSPAVWGDEAATYDRVVGTYPDLLDQLITDGFGPLHYSFYWWFAQPHTWPVPWQVQLTPFYLRLLPAVAGTLMVPAMYFLTRQLFGPKVALVAALFTCCSAFMLVFSRDAKMYQHFWLCCTVHVASLLWWLRSRRRDAYLLWLATGIAMVGLHALGLFIVGLSFIFYFLAPRQHWLKLVELPVLIVLTPVWCGWRLMQSLGAKRQRRQVLAGPPADRTDGNATRMDGLTDRHLQTGTAQRFSQRFKPPVEADESASKPDQSASALVHHHPVNPSAPAAAAHHARFSSRLMLWTASRLRHFYWPPLPFYAVGVLVILSTLFFTPWGYYSGFNAFVDQTVNDRGDLNPDKVGLGWIDRYNATRTGGDLTLMTYTAYLFSWEWPRSSDNPDLNDAAAVPQRTLTLLHAATYGLSAMLAIGLVPWRKLFPRPHLTDPRQPDLEDVYAPYRRMRVLWLTIWLTLPTYAIYLCSFKSVWTPWNGITWVLTGKTDLRDAPRLDESAIRSLGAGDGLSAQVVSVWHFLTLWVLAVWHEATLWYQTIRTYPWADYNPVVVIGLGAIALLLLGGVIWRRRVLFWTSVQLLLAVAGAFVILCFVQQVVRPLSNLWMPRYLGFIWPAFAIVIATLVMRLPTRPVRAIVLGALLGVNLIQFFARVDGHSEPPTQQMAGDVLAGMSAAQPEGQPPTTLTLFSGNEVRRFSMPEPGGGIATSGPMRYYVHLKTRSAVKPGAIRTGWSPAGRNAFPIEFADRLTDVTDRLRRQPAVNRIVLWSAYPPGMIDQQDRLGDALKPDWHTTHDDVIPVRDHWRWMDLYTLRRREYEKTPE